jgi:hypothetical protein
MLAIWLQKISFTLKIQQISVDIRWHRTVINTIYKHPVLGVYEIKIRKIWTSFLAAYTTICDWRQYTYIHIYTHTHTYIYTGCLRRNVPDFRRMFLKLKYTDLTKNTYIWSWTVTEIMAREKCGLFTVPHTVPGSRDVLPVHCACPSFSLQLAQVRSRCDCTCKVLGTLKTTATLMWVFM